MPDNNPIPLDFPSGWLPVSFDRKTRKIIWVEGNGVSLTEPFYEDILQKLKIEKRKTFTCSLEKIEEISSNLPGGQIIPAAFIFHISRCGSTLFAQILAQSQENSVFSEPRFMDEVLGSDLIEEVKMRLVQNLVQLMRKSDTRANHLFIKWDSWHSHYFNFLKKVFPDVPMVFLYRNPMAVLRSHQKLRGMQMVPGMLVPDVFKIKGVPCHDLNLYAVRVLKKIMEKMVSTNYSKIWYINYNQLPGAVFGLLQEWGLKYNKKDIACMHARTKLHSKYMAVFTPEKQIQNETGQRLEKLVDDFLKRPYLKLESMNHYEKKHDNSLLK